MSLVLVRALVSLTRAASSPACEDHSGPNPTASLESSAHVDTPRQNQSEGQTQPLSTKLCGSFLCPDLKARRRLKGETQPIDWPDESASSTNTVAAFTGIGNPRLLQLLSSGRAAFSLKRKAAYIAVIAALKKQ